MTRSKVPTLHCDGGGHYCEAWDLDDYAMDVTASNDVPITKTHRSLGWFSTDDEDFCPEHAPKGVNS